MSFLDSSCPILILPSIVLEAVGHKIKRTLFDSIAFLVFCAQPILLCPQDSIMQKLEGNISQKMVGKREEAVGEVRVRGSKATGDVEGGEEDAVGEERVRGSKATEEGEEEAGGEVRVEGRLSLM